MNFLKKILIIVVLMMSSLTHLYSDDIALGVKVGTLGIGGDVIFGMTDHFNVRVGLNTYDWSYDGEESGIDYDVDLELSSINLFVDFFPFSSGFHLTGGMVKNDNEIKLDGKLDSTLVYEIGSQFYSVSQIGSLGGVIDFDDWVPYLGIGWGNAVKKDALFCIAFDLGIVFQGEPNVLLISNEGTLTTNTGFQQDLRLEEQDVQDWLDSFKFYPVLTLSFSYQF